MWPSSSLGTTRIPSCRESDGPRHGPSRRGTSGTEREPRHRASLSGLASTLRTPTPKRGGQGDAGSGVGPSDSDAVQYAGDVVTSTETVVIRRPTPDVFAYTADLHDSVPVNLKRVLEDA